MTVTAIYDPEQWQLVPKVATQEMIYAMFGSGSILGKESEARLELGYQSLLEAAPQHESQWQPIETAPKDGRRLLLAFDNPDADVVYKYHTDRIAELGGLKRQLKITKARLFKAQAEFETMALHATMLEQANARLTAHIKQIAAKHDVQRHDNYGNSYLVDLHETFRDFALSGLEKP